MKWGYLMLCNGFLPSREGVNEDKTLLILQLKHGKVNLMLCMFMAMLDQIHFPCKVLVVASLEGNNTLLWTCCDECNASLQDHLYLPNLDTPLGSLHAKVICLFFECQHNYSMPFATTLFFQWLYVRPKSFLSKSDTRFWMEFSHAFGRGELEKFVPPQHDKWVYMCM